jgi:twitching motility protein PilJ
VADAFAGERRGQTIATGAAILFAILAFAVWRSGQGVSRRRALARLGSEQENRRNQEAILRLLNEMGTLADGDLTVKASVTEDVTGAIADSINFTVEELRNVVVGINSSTEQVSKATAETQAISIACSKPRSGSRARSAGIGVGAADGAIDQRSVASRRPSRPGAQQSLAAAEKGRSRCRTRSPG